jgi:hypothetical protein
MRRLHKLRDWWRTTIASVSVLLGILIHRSVETVPLQVQFVVGLVVLGIVIHSSEIMLSTILDNARWLRKAVLGDRFVEGLWFEVVHDQPEDHNSRIKYGALITIKFDDGELSISGDVYDAASGMPVGAFTSRRVAFEEELTYVYDQVMREQVAMRQVGFGLLFFASGTGRPSSFNGYFVDPNFPRPLGVYGKRVHDSVADKLTSDDNARRAHVKAFVDEYRSMRIEQHPVPARTSV